MKDLTPPAMRCAPLHCPSVGQLEDGRLLIVGKIAPWLEVNEDSSPVDRESWPVSVGDDETAIIIDPALLDEFVAGKFAEAQAEIERLVGALDSDEFAVLKAENERLRQALSTPIQGITLGTDLEGKITEQEALALVNASRTCLLAGASLPPTDREGA